MGTIRPTPEHFRGKANLATSRAIDHTPTTTLEERYCLAISTIWSVLEGVSRPKLRDLKAQMPSPQMQSREEVKDLQTALRSLPIHRKRLLTHAHQRTTEEQLWKECQRKQTLTIASDGGLKENQGTFGRLLSTSSNNILAEGSGPVDGPFDTSNSTRSELGGYAAPLLFLSSLHSMWGKQHKCSFRWVTDSKSAIANVK